MNLVHGFKVSTLQRFNASAGVSLDHNVVRITQYAVRSDMTKKLDSEETLDRLLSEEVAVVYKHSTRCPTSTQAKHHIIRFVKSHPDLPVYIVDVLSDRPISQEAAARLGVRHESPQAIVVKNGEAVWHISHYGVRKAAIEKALDSI